MTKSTFNPDNLPTEIFEDGSEFVQSFIPGAWSEVEDVMREVFARLPYGESIKLSNGREFHLKKFIEPRIGSEGRWMFGFDAVFPDAQPGTMDHFEFVVRHSGGGGSVGAAGGKGIPETPAD